MRLLRARLLPLLAGACIVFSQTLGTVTGQLRDATGAAVPGVEITVRNTQTNVVRTVITNEEGLYVVPALNPGSYEVKASKTGFKTATRAAFDLQVQQTARVDFTLDVGQVSESVEVSASATLLNTEDATVGTVIEQKRITDLPLNGRNFLQLVRLSPNVTAQFGTNNQSGRMGGDRMNQQMSVAGARATSNNYTLDGVANTDVNFNTYVVLPSVDMLQEFKVQSGVYPAEFGRAASQINVSTRSGTNQYHASIYEFVRNDKMDARAYDFTAADHTRAKNPFQWNQYGFTFGGPVRIPKVVDGRNKLFFMANYEVFRQRGRPVNVYSLPTEKMRNGDFSELNIGLWDPVGRVQNGSTIVATPFPGNIIPITRQSFQTKLLYEFAPLPNGPSESAPGAVPQRNFRQSNRNTNDKDQFHLRIDWNESARSSWYGRYSWSDEAEVNRGLKLNGGKILTNAKQYMLNNTRSISPTMVNEFRFGVNELFNAASGELAYVRDVLSELKIPGVNPAPGAAWGAPSVTNIASISTWGGGGDPFEIRNAAFQAVDTFSLIRGKHSFRFGAEIRRDRFNTIGNQFLNPEFQFNGTMTQDPNSKVGGSGLADYFLGFTSNPRYAVSPAFLQLRGTSTYFFIDDVYHIKPNLTVNFGLRYEYSAPFTDRANRYANIDMPAILMGVINVPDQALHPTMVRSGSTGGFYDDLPFRYPNVKVARDGRLGKAMINPDKNDFAPRLGIAWNPTPKWSIRTGAGIFYSAEVANSKFDLARTLGGRRDGATASNFPTITVENFLGPPGTLLQLSNPWTWQLDRNIRNMYMFQYLFNVQRELSNGLMIEAGYIGSISRHLTGLYDPNQAVLRGDGSAAFTRAPFPEFGIIQTIHGNGHGNYNAGSLKVTKRFQSGLTALVGYTYSKSIDTASAWRGAGDAPSANDATCYLACERAPSGYHIPQRMVTSILYELPFGKGKRFGSNLHAVPNAIVSGWQMSSIVTFQSGRVTNVTGGRNSVAYQDGQRPSATGLAIALPDSKRSLDRWFNTAAVAIPAAGVMGNIGRNVVIGPTQQSWDFSAHKAFRIMEGHSLTFRFEAFNMANHPVFGRPSTGVGNGSTLPAGFGQIRGTDASMRQIQLGLKYVF